MRILRFFAFIYIYSCLFSSYFVCVRVFLIFNKHYYLRYREPFDPLRSRPSDRALLVSMPQNEDQAYTAVTPQKGNIALTIHTYNMCDYLTSFGPTSDEKKAATRIMQKIMYNSVARNYNFDGHGEKIGFRTLNLWTVIEGTLSLKSLDSDLDITFKTIKSWLRNANGRKQEESNASNNH